MKNGDLRSAKWITRRLTKWQRDNETVEVAMLLVDLEPTPTIEEIATWSDEQCLLAEDWAFAVHLSASDNNNRVPAVPAHLVDRRKAAA